MKICMIARTYPPRIGGAGSVVQKVSYGLVDKGFDVSVICSRVKGTPRFEIDKGVSVHRVMNVSDTSEFTFLNLGISVSSMVRKVVECGRHDIFHAHDISVAGFSGGIAKKFVNKPFFLKYGGDLVLEYLSLKKFSGWDPRKGLEGTLEYRGGVAGVLHHIQSWYFRTYDLLLPNSFYGKDFLEERGVPDCKQRVLVNGVDVDMFYPVDGAEKDELKELYGLSGKIIFTAVRLVGWKGIDVLIDAMQVVFSKVDATLVIAGTGPEEEHLRSMVGKYGFGEKVFFLGDVPREKMPKYLSLCDVFVLPSYFEMAPNVLLEAMACGCPCVVSDIGGVREIVEGDCALLVNVADSKDIGSKLVDVLLSPALALKLSRRARRRIVGRYSWKKVIVSYVDVYESYL